MCFVIFYNLIKTFLILRRNQQYIVLNVKKLRIKYSLFVSDSNGTYIFSTGFFKKSQILHLIKIRLLGAELFHADGQTDGRTNVTKLIVAFRNFSNALKNALKPFEGSRDMK